MGEIGMYELRYDANIHDRPCDKCGVPMIGIMRVSGKQTPRKVCHSCGGNPTTVEERLGE
jgi:hypothetical protein